MLTTVTCCDGRTCEELDWTSRPRFVVRPGDILINRVNPRHLTKCDLAVSFDVPLDYESNMMRLTLDDSRMVTSFR